MTIDRQFKSSPSMGRLHARHADSSRTDRLSTHSPPRENSLSPRPGVHVRRDVQILIFGVAVAVQISLNPPSAWADDLVTYEVDSGAIKTANIEYEDFTGRVSTQNVTLPWRADVKVQAVRAAPPTGSQVRADWRPTAGPAKWVSVRIIYQGKILCQNTLDVGDAACYGITPRIT